MDKIGVIKQEAEQLLAKMISSPQLEVVQEENIFHIIIKTQDEAPTVIGRHGETIRALQKILEVILYKKLGEPVDILVNINDYREKQKERLEGIAKEVAERTKETGQPGYLRGMSSYERKLIHEYITQNYPQLSTYSIGEGRDRRLVIDLKKS
jgi:spoIIIJ-associated protein